MIILFNSLFSRRWYHRFRNHKPVTDNWFNPRYPRAFLIVCLLFTSVFILIMIPRLYYYALFILAIIFNALLIKINNSIGHKLFLIDIKNEEQGKHNIDISKKTIII